MVTWVGSVHIIFESSVGGISWEDFPMYTSNGRLQQMLLYRHRGAYVAIEGVIKPYKIDVLSSA